MTIETIMFDRFTTLFGKPLTPSPKAFLDEYRREFGKLDPELLQATVNALVRSHEYPTWPTIGAINRELKHQAEHFTFRQSLTALPAPKHVPPTKEQKARVNALIRRMKGAMTEGGKIGEAA